MVEGGHAVQGVGGEDAQEGAARLAEGASPGVAQGVGQMTGVLGANGYLALMRLACPITGSIINAHVNIGELSPADAKALLLLAAAETDVVEGEYVALGPVLEE